MGEVKKYQSGEMTSEQVDLVRKALEQYLDEYASVDDTVKYVELVDMFKVENMIPLDE